MSAGTAEPRTVYSSRHARFSQDQAAFAARSRRISNARLIAFLFFAVGVVWVSERAGLVAAVVTVTAATAFTILIVLHTRAQRAEQHAAALRDLAAAGLARLDRTWDRLPVWDDVAAPAGHLYADDLDLFGHGSLSQLLGGAASPQGRARLAGWLLELPPPVETRARQDAVRELNPRIEFRDELAVRAAALRSVRGDDVAAFTAWCEERDYVPSWMNVAAFVVPISLWASAALRVAGIWSANIWLVPALAAVYISFAAPGSRARRTFARVFRREPLFANVPELLGHLAECDYEAMRLQQIREALRSTGNSPRVELERLRRIAHLSDLRRSTLYLPIQLLTLWDQHVLRSLYAWRRRSGPYVRQWLDAAADAEALCAMATLAHDHPDWTYPVVEADADRIQATSLGHPLLAPGVRVDNNVTIGPRGTFLLVTGSNMSGKSTLLRAVGINIVLARAGAPACAARMTLPVAVPCTSMRVQDSLALGVSFFMAELQRMRTIVSAAETATSDGWACVFLVDEMLHGTNSAERRIASRSVIERLVRLGAIGAVSTHDLQLGSEPALRALAVRVHFTETVHTQNGRPVMTFDYKLRPGDATSTNALVLLELMGLGGE